MEIRANAIEIWDIEKIIPNPKNSNEHDDDQIKRLSEIFEYSGFREPLIVSQQTGYLVTGHCRLLSAMKLGVTQLPVMVQDFDDPAMEYAHIQADNAIAEWSRINMVKVNNDFIDYGPNLPVEMLGFKDFKIEPIEKLVPQSLPDEIPQVEKIDPITKRGDVWILGESRVMCGDSTMIDDLEKLMDGQRADIMFTSPPYNAGDEVEIGSKGQKYETHDDAMNEDSYLRLLNDFTSNALMFCDMAIVNIQQLAGNKITFIDYLSAFKNNFVDVAIWNKTYGTPSLPKRVMNCAFEYILFFSNEMKPPRTIKTAPMFHGRIQNVYDGAKQTKNEYSKVHRATFPVHLPHHVIENFSTGSVLDLFNGTGTTLIACETLERQYFGMEMDPLYVDITIKRWEDYTGKKAELLRG